MHLLSRLLAFDPSRRCSAEEALTHEYLHCFEAIDTQMGQPAYFSTVTMHDPSSHKQNSALHNSCSKQAMIQIHLQHSKPSRATLCHAMPCHALLCHAVLCCTTLRCAVLCCRCSVLCCAIDCYRCHIGYAALDCAALHCTALCCVRIVCRQIRAVLFQTVMCHMASTALQAKLTCEPSLQLH